MRCFPQPAVILAVGRLSAERYPWLRAAQASARTTGVLLRLNWRSRLVPWIHLARQSTHAVSSDWPRKGRRLGSPCDCRRKTAVAWNSGDGTAVSCPAATKQPPSAEGCCVSYRPVATWQPGAYRLGGRRASPDGGGGEVVGRRDKLNLKPKSKGRGLRSPGGLRILDFGGTPEEWSAPDAAANGLCHRMTGLVFLFLVTLVLGRCLIADRVSLARLEHQRHLRRRTEVYQWQYNR